MKLLKTLSKILAVILLSIIVLTVKSGSTSATAYNVAAGTDGLNGGDFICTLSEAIANIDDGGALYSDCAAPSGSDTINLPSGTITLSADLPLSLNPYSVVGQGRGVSIVDGAGYSGMFRTILPEDGSSESVSFSNFTAKNTTRTTDDACISVSNGSTSVTGSQGDFEENDVEITNVYLEDCGAYGVALNLPNSSVLIDGAEMSSSYKTDTIGVFILRIGDITVRNSAIYGQALGVFTFQGAYSGNNSSAISTDINIINSTFTDNKLALGLNASNSSNTDAAISLNLNLINNTVVGNASTSSSGAWANMGTSGILLATGGNPVLNLVMTNNLLANNTFNGSPKNCYAGTSQYSVNVIVTSTNNLADDTCSGKLGGTDFANVSGITTSLDALADNGGPAKTMALLIGSAAIDQGMAVGSVTSDARGVARPQNSVYDIGAYEKTAESTPDPDPEPEDPDNPGPPGSNPDSPLTPGVPRTGKLIGAFLASISLVVLLVLVSKEMIDGRIRLNKSTR